MSNVTDCFVIVGDPGYTEDGTAETIAPKVAEIIRGFIYYAAISRVARRRRAVR